MPTVELDIRQLADEGGTAPLAPITVTDAVLDEDGNTLTDTLDEIKSGLIVDQLVTETKSWSQGVSGQNFGTYTKSGYTLIGVLPVSLPRSSTTLFAFQGTTGGLVYMTTNSNYAESDVSLTVRLLWKKN